MSGWEGAEGVVVVGVSVVVLVVMIEGWGFLSPSWDYRIRYSERWMV